MFHGSMVALVTPLTARGEVDEQQLAKLVQFHQENGTKAIIAAGTTGEAGTLSDKEKQRVIAICVGAASDGLAVIAGTGANSTTHAKELTQMAMEQGADAALLMTPAYIKPSQNGLFQHYQLIAEAVALPQILYNVPSRTACDLKPETVAELAQLANIIGIKEASGELARTQQLIECCGDRLDVYSGEDAQTLAMFRLGAKGVISVTANVAPQLMAQFCNAALDEQWAEAEAINQRLLPLHHALFVESNPIPVKWVLSEMGLINAAIRLPLTPLSRKHHDKLRAVIEHLR